MTSTTIDGAPAISPSELARLDRERIAYYEALVRENAALREQVALLRETVEAMDRRIGDLSLKARGRP